MARSHGCLKENEKHRLSVLNNFAIFNNKKENALKKIKRSKVVKLESLSNSWASVNSTCRVDTVEK